jgi:hypothetical protein
VAKAEEHLLCKLKALSSNPIPTKKKTKKQKTGGSSCIREVDVQIAVGFLLFFVSYISHF